MIELKKMTEPDFAVFNEANIDALTDLFSGELPANKARERAENEQREFLPGGAATPGQFLFSITENGDFRGGLWFTEIERKGTNIAFLFFIWIKPEYRRKGLGSEAMKLLESEVRKKGLSIIRLHVLRENKNAVRVYEKTGYKLFTDYERYNEKDPGMIMEKLLT